MRDVLIFIGLKIAEAGAVFGLGRLGGEFYLWAYSHGWYQGDAFVENIWGQCLFGSFVLYVGLAMAVGAIAGIIYGNVQLVKKITGEK